MKASDWHYQGEGGKHAVFCHQETKKLLRVEKKLLVAAAAEQPELTHGKTVSSSVDPLYYIREMVHRRLDVYTDLPDLVTMTRAFCSELRDQAIKTGRIPPPRLSDWTRSSTCTSFTEGTITGQIWKDYRFFSSKNSNTITWEIKPKAGYLTRSPLVDPRRRSKFLVSRYQLFQRLIGQRRGVVKGWMKTTHVRTSRYDPLDLFLGDKRKALEALLECPQNNLKIWRGEELLLSDEVSNPLPDQEWMLETLTTVLSNETCLESLLGLQKLDVLDADGIDTVYQRLEDLGSLSLLDHSPVLRATTSTCAPKLLENSPIQAPEKRAHIDAYCEVYQSLSRQLDESTPELPDLELLDASREHAKRIISSFSAGECIYLLQNWLLSLAMCDVSLLVTVELPERGHARVPGRPRVVRKQQSAQPGVLACGGGTFQYRLKIIDFDEKPGKKLQRRAEREDCFNGLSNSGFVEKHERRNDPKL